MSTFQAKIEFIPGAAHPDEYDPIQGRIPPKNFVVTRKKDGSALSLYGYLCWDRTPYQTKAKPFYLYFDYWAGHSRKRTAIHREKEKLDWAERMDEVTPARIKIVEDLQWLMFILIYLYKGKSLSNATLQSYCSSFHVIGRIAEKEKLAASEVLRSPLLLGKIPKSKLKTLAPFLFLLRDLGSDIVGFEVIDPDAIKKLAALVRTWKDSVKQTPPIPTKIYSMILSSISDELEQFETFAPRILALYNACAIDPLLGKTQSAQQRIKKKLELQRQPKRRLDFSELIHAHGLASFWENRGYPKTFLSITTVMLEAFEISARQIQAYSGMRKNELEELPYDCLKEIWRNEDGKMHSIIQGRVTKLSNGKIKRVQWVTSNSGRKAILLAQQFSRAIYTAATLTQKNCEKIKPVHLFVSPRFGLRRSAGHNTASFSHLNDRLESRLLPLIDEEDIRELQFIDPDRNWRSEAAFQVGQPWPLASHQMRRSLALYAQASGLVSLPSLKRQLQHITREMALYYARGSQFAIDFIGNGNEDKHFGEEWQEAQPVSQYLAYAAHVLMVDENELFGNHSHFVNKRLRDDKGVVLFDRAGTLKRFNDGRMAFRETLLGGCTKVGPCDKNPLDLFHVGCITSHCKNMVGERKKLDRAVKIQSNLVAKLKLEDVTTPEYRHEKSNLDVLLKVQNDRFSESVA